MKLMMRIVLSLLLFSAARVSTAQATIALDKDEYGNGDKMLVTVTVPAGQSVSEPRFHFIADGMPLPKRNSTRWIEFPAIATTQQLKLVVPDAVERDESASWWLLLFDGDRLVARMPFDVAGWLLRLEQKRTELEADLSGTGGAPAPAGPETGGAASTPSTAAAGTESFSRGYLRMTPLEPLIGEVFTVIVTLPAAAPGDPALASLKWGDTGELSWNEKEKAPELGDSISTDVPGAVTGPQSISVSAPFSRPGRYELRLFRGQQLLDVMAVTVGD